MPTKTDYVVTGVAIIGGLFVIGMLVVGWLIYRYIEPHRDYYEWNELMTITVETPEGVVEGQTVRALVMGYAPNNQRNHGDVSMSMEGETAALELRPNTVLFVSFGNAGSRLPNLAGDVFRLPSARSRPRIFELIQELPDVYAFTEETRYPDMIIIPNIEEPTEALGVQPGTLSEVMGEGYRILSVTLEVTELEPTVGHLEPFLQGLFASRDEFGVIPRIPLSGRLNSDPSYTSTTEIGLPFFYPRDQWRSIWRRFNTECVNDYWEVSRNPDGPPMCLQR